MGGDRGVYSDEEFALILRKAAELAESTDTRSPSAGGLTLTEMKAAAAQAGFDPALVERAARMLRADVAASPSFMERLIGGQTRHGSEAHFPIVLDEQGAANLLSAVRISLGGSGDGHSGPTGLTWRSSDEAGAVLSLTALTGDDGTAVTADLDRRGPMVLVGTLTAAAAFGALLFGATVAGEIAPGLEAVGGLSGVGAVLVGARSYWASSTGRARERLGRAMDSVNRFLAQPGSGVPVGATADRAEASEAREEPAAEE